MASDYSTALTALSSRKPTATLLLGPAGCGKTHCALEAALKNPDVRRIAVVRKPESFGADYGYLPGSLEEKQEPWNQNICQLVENLGYNANEMRASGKLVFPSFSHIQGMTFDNTFLIIDEAQLLTWDELYVVCSRVGKYSWLALTGDTQQVGGNVKNSGWSKLVQNVYDSKSLSLQAIWFKDGINHRSELCHEVNKLFRGDIR